MRVITVDDRGFKEMCESLRRQVSDSGYEFDTLVGVARAGVFVAERFDGGRGFFVVKSQRGGTATKRGLVGKILRAMPSCFNILLRWAESSFLEFKDRLRPARLKPVVLDDSLCRCLADGGHRVLVVDDAVDSGKSMLSVVDAMKAVSSENEIRSAVITVTRRAPLINPDYALFRDSTLIRFPWAADIKKEDE